MVVSRKKLTENVKILFPRIRKPLDYADLILEGIKIKAFNSDDSCIQKATQFVYQTTDDPERLEKLLLVNYLQLQGKLPHCNELLS